MMILKDPFFWAFVSMFSLLAGCHALARKSLGQNPLYGFLVVATFALGRAVLVLPALPQPRFATGGWHRVLGGVLFALGAVFTIPAFTIKPLTAPDEKVVLRTTGFYGIVRNPIYLAELLWCSGWSILFRSVIGVLLVPFWWASLLFITLVEEERLERLLGQPYLEYKKRVRGRIIPGLPV